MKTEEIVEKLRIAWQWFGYDHEYDREAIKEASKGLEDVIDYFESKPVDIDYANFSDLLSSISFYLPHNISHIEKNKCSNACPACKVYHYQDFLRKKLEQKSNSNAD